MKRFLFLCALFGLTFFSWSQEIIRVMHYNLLNYDINTGGCNATNNNVNDKNVYLRTILEYVNPHIITVNEINCSVQTYDKLLDDCLDIYRPGLYERVDKTCPSNTALSNMIYYREDILSFHSQEVVATNVRDINLVRLYYDAPDLGNTFDTVFLTCIVAHLKAGSDWDDELERADETNRLMNFLEQSGYTGNMLFMGDFNVYDGSEEAFQNIVNPDNTDFLFHDPIDQIGDWHNNSYFSPIHTQSTHTVQNCFISGGMDDRFDFILISKSIKNVENKVAYVEGSYRAVGQDGQRFNKSLVESPVNSSVPSDVLDALYNMSDHLPVMLDLAVGHGAGIFDAHSTSVITISNPVKDRIILRFSSPISDQVQVIISSVTGSILKTYPLEAGQERVEFPAASLASGFYLIGIYSNRSLKAALRIVKL